MDNKYVIDNKKVIKFLLTFAVIIFCIYITFASFKYLAPFIIAFAIAAIMEPMVKLMTNKTKIPRKLMSFIALICVMAIIGSVFYLAILKIISEVKDIIYNTPDFIKEFYNNIDLISTGSDKFIINFPTDVTAFLRNGLAKLLTSFENLLSSFLGIIINTAMLLPATIAFIIITILAAYFISSDRIKIKENIKSKIPEEIYNGFSGLKKDVFSSLVKLVKGYMIIMSITFTEAFIGLSIINIKYSLVVAFVICIVDILPVLGTGTVLIPWGVYEIIIHNTKMGISIIILYLIITVIRQIIEPKIIGHQIGVHPLVSLMSLYVGLKLLGTAGLILGPIIVIIIKNIYSTLYKDKTIHDIFFRLEDNEKIKS